MQWSALVGLRFRMCSMCCHVWCSECEYMEESLHHMYLTINEMLQSEGESVQQCWLLAQNMEEKVMEKVAAIVNMDVRAVTPDALWELGLGVKTLVGTVEARLSAVNTASELWPVSCEMWAPEVVGPQIEAIPTIACVPPNVGILLEAAG